MTFVLIRGERLRCTGRKAMWKQTEERGEAAPDPETQGATGSWWMQEGFSSADLGGGLAY